MTENTVYITPSDVIEYLYCPRFVYYLKVLDIKQHEEKKYLVIKGRDIHLKKLVQNKEYLRKQIGSTHKELNVYMVSTKLHMIGIIDEVHFLDGNYAAIIDYKYSYYDGRIYDTLKYQQVLYALLVEEIFDKIVKNAYIVYVRSNNKLLEIPITDKIKTRGLKFVDEIFNIVSKNTFPNGTKNKKRCDDCCYRNLCEA